MSNDLQVQAVQLGQQTLQSVSSIGQAALQNAASSPAVQTSMQQAGKNFGQGAKQGLEFDNTEIALMGVAGILVVGLFGLAAWKAYERPEEMDAFIQSSGKYRNSTDTGYYDDIAWNRAYVHVGRRLRAMGVSGNTDKIALGVVALTSGLGGPAAHEAQKVLSPSQLETLERLAQHVYSNPGLYNESGSVRL